MPNECSNYITITSKSENELNDLLQQDIKSIPNVELQQITKKGIRAFFITSWGTDYEWLETLLYKYPSCWIKNEWDIEDGHRGIWIGYHNKEHQKIIKCFEWDDISLEAEEYFFCIK